MDQRARQRQLLLHAPGQLVGEPAPERRELRHVEQVIAALRVVRHIVDGGEERDVLVHGQVAVQAEALRQVAHLVGDGTVIARRVSTEHADLPLVGMDQAADRTDGGGLAGAVRTDEAEHLAARDIERQSVQGRHGAVALAHVDQRDSGRRVMKRFHIGAAMRAGRAGGHGARPNATERGHRQARRARVWRPPACPASARRRCCRR